MSEQSQPQPQAYPLQWPSGFPRWKNGRGSGTFKTNFETALRNVKKSLELFAKDSGKKIVDPVLSSNIDFNPLTINTGTRPTDPGVAVWFSWDGLQVCIPVDRYDTPAANPAGDPSHHRSEARRAAPRHARFGPRDLLRLPGAAGAEGQALAGHS